MAGAGAEAVALVVLLLAWWARADQAVAVGLESSAHSGRLTSRARSV